ncbi:hypothetical protein ACT4MK_19380 [Bradyrhizobium barranii]|uniref:hypothetical protein n=1 Tax=Bradyrhizobium TaxID=374 RepID=UPI003F2909B1
MMRPLKQRAWTKRDQEEWLARMPVVLCEPIKHVDGGHWLWRHWCPWCKCHHHHSPAPGHRDPHCTDANSPFHQSGYVLRIDPQFAERDGLCQLERSEAAWRAEAVAARKAAWLATPEGQAALNESNVRVAEDPT